MAHIGKKLTLGPACLFCLVFRDGHFRIDFAQFECSGIDFFLEVFTMTLKLRVSLLDLTQHFIESVDEHSHFVIAGFLSSHSEGFFHRNDFYGFGQPQERPGDQALQP
jgi:hypothetical protein